MLPSRSPGAAAPLPPSIIAMLGRSDSTVEIDNVANSGASKEGDDPDTFGMRQPIISQDMIWLHMQDERQVDSGARKLKHTELPMKSVSSVPSSAAKSHAHKHCVGCEWVVGSDRSLGSVEGATDIDDFGVMTPGLNTGSASSLGMGPLPSSPPSNMALGALGGEDDRCNAACMTPCMSRVPFHAVFERNTRWRSGWTREIMCVNLLLIEEEAHAHTPMLQVRRSPTVTTLACHPWPALPGVT